MGEATKVFLPYRAEFGFIVWRHVPQVYAAQGPKVAVIERGLESLYPGCDWWYVDRKDDKERRARLEKDYCDQWVKNNRKRLEFRFGSVEFVPPKQIAPQKRFIPKPLFVPSGMSSGYDVCVCPRKREYGADKNWSHWQELVNMLSASLDVFAAGHPETSYDLEGVDSAWSVIADGAWYLDSTIAGMLRSRVVVATDNGLAHLAILCGKPLILISHGDGLVADGYDDVGHPYWPIKIQRFREANHCGVPIDIVRDSWYDPTLVSDVVKTILGVDREG